MAVNKVVTFIEGNIAKFAKAFAKEVHKSKYLNRYKGFTEEELISRNEKVFKKLTEFLEDKLPGKEVGRFFVKIGKERYKEGFPLCEVIYALYLTKNIFWKKIREEGFFSSALDVYVAMETLKSIYDFFDVGAIYIIRGYEEEMYQELGQTGKLSEDDLKKVFFPGSFKNDELVIKSTYKNIPFFDWKW